jgi:hypothetical protein
VGAAVALGAVVFAAEAATAGGAALLGAGGAPHAARSREEQRSGARLFIAVEP